MVFIRCNLTEQNAKRGDYQLGMGKIYGRRPYGRLVPNVLRRTQYCDSSLKSTVSGARQLIRELWFQKLKTPDEFNEHTYHRETRHERYRKFSGADKRVYSKPEKFWEANREGSYQKREEPEGGVQNHWKVKEMNGAECLDVSLSTTKYGPEIYK